MICRDGGDCGWICREGGLTGNSTRQDGAKLKLEMGPELEGESPSLENPKVLRGDRKNVICFPDACQTFALKLAFF